MPHDTRNIIQQENARLKDENNRLKQELNTLRGFVSILTELADIASSVTSDEELMPTLRAILVRAMDLLNAPDGSLSLADETTNELVFVLVLGSLASQLEGYRLPADEGIAGWVYKNRQPALVRDARRDQRFFAEVDEKFRFKTQSVAAAPLIGNGKAFGVVEVLNQPGDDPFSEVDMALLNLLCRFAGEALADIEARESSQS